MLTPLILRRISMVVLVTFTSLTMQPLQAAIQQQDKVGQGGANSQLPQRLQQQTRYQPALAQHDDALSRTLVEMDAKKDRISRCDLMKQCCSCNPLL